MPSLDARTQASASPLWLVTDVLMTLIDDLHSAQHVLERCKDYFRVLVGTLSNRRFTAAETHWASMLSVRGSFSQMRPATRMLCQAIFDAAATLAAVEAQLLHLQVPCAPIAA